MRRAVLATIFAAACSFQHGAAGVSGSDGGGVTSSSDDGATPTIDAPATTSPSTCHSSLPGLRLCIDFESTSFARDVSGLGHVVDVTNIGLTSRGTQGAANLAPDSSIYVESRSDLDVSPNMTIEMWVEPHSNPAPNDRAWLLASNSEYGLSYTAQGVTCGVSSVDTNMSTTAAIQLPVDQWTHVACVYDGSKLLVYLGGNGASCSQQSLTIDNSIDAGLDIGSFDGAIDDVHLYAAALTDQDICHLATGGPLCKPATCGIGP